MILIKKQRPKPLFFMTVSMILMIFNDPYDDSDLIT